MGGGRGANESKVAKHIDCKRPENPRDEMFRFVCIGLRLAHSVGVKWDFCKEPKSKKKKKKKNLCLPVAAHRMFHKSVGVALT